ncbi:MAG: cyclic nucleotide-binding domain-containing protein [Thermodesulfobacteriota bacterium]
MNNQSIRPDHGKRSFKEEAHQALSQGHWRKALDYFQKHCSQEPEDLRSQLKVAELLERLGQKKEAVQVYRQVAEDYAQDGFLLQAISINKLILRIDPYSKDINDRLAQLYTKKTLETRPLRPYPHIPLFSELNEQELQLFLRHLQIKTFQKGALICFEGETGDSLFIISRGEVAVNRQMPSGREVWIRNLKEGDFFGEFGFFTDQKRHATVKSLTECEILEISRNELNGMIKTHPHIKEVLQNLFNQRVLDLFLGLSPLFSSLTPVEREEVFKRFHLHKIPEETLLFKGGDPPKSLYMVKSGEVELFTQNRQGKKIVLATMRSGNIFGEIGPLFNKPRMAFAKTIRPSELLELTKEDLEECIHQFPKLRSILKETSFKRLARTKEILSQEEVEKVKEGLV